MSILRLNKLANNINIAFSLAVDRSDLVQLLGESRAKPGKGVVGQDTGKEFLLGAVALGFNGLRPTQENLFVGLDRCSMQR
jgi:hypothetical protein